MVHTLPQRFLKEFFYGMIQYFSLVFFSKNVFNNGINNSSKGFKVSVISGITSKFPQGILLKIHPKICPEIPRRISAALCPRIVPGVCSRILAEVLLKVSPKFLQNWDFSKDSSRDTIEGFFPKILSRVPWGFFKGFLQEIIQVFPRISSRFNFLWILWNVVANVRWMQQAYSSTDNSAVSFAVSFC